MLLFLSGCALTHTSKSVPVKISTMATSVFSTSKLIYMPIPSHGPVPDMLDIAANGGGNARQLKGFLDILVKSNNKKIVVYSSNPSLSKSVIEGALNANKKFPGIWLAYAGDKRNSDILKPLVESKGIKYSFINICSTDSVNVLCSLD